MDLLRRFDRVVVGFTLALSGCPAPQVVNEGLPLPPTEKLQAADCEAGVELYRQRLQLPPRAGSVVTSRQPTPLSVEEQARRIAGFSAQCQKDLVGRARRLIVNCWNDSLDAETPRGCNQRF